RPTAFKSNGTMKANTTGIQTQPNCVLADQVQLTGGQITGSGAGCQFSATSAAAGVDYGVNVVGACNFEQSTPLPAPVKPVAFWFTNPGGSPSSAAVVCTPKLSLHNVTITLNLANGQLIDVTPIGDYDLPTNVTSGPPLNGRVWNGVEFNTTNADADTLLRANTTQLQLASSVFNLLQRNTYDKVLGDAAQIVNITATRYQLFLALSARSNFFVTDNSGTHLPVVIKEIQQRLWMERLATHLLTVVLILGGIVGGLVHYLHYMERRDLKLYAAPGSIAVAASVTTDSPVHNMLRSGMDANKMRDALSGETFGVDNTGRIILARDVEP
ncbi:1026_t:CDS:2, partial [Acaulospora colombiana]